MKCYKCQKFDHVWDNCKQLLAVYGVEMATSIKSASRKVLRISAHIAAAVHQERGENLTLPPTEDVTMQRSCCCNNLSSR
jgi:hypothetical protein